MLKVYVEQLQDPLSDVKLDIPKEPVLFRELNSEALTGEDVIMCIAPIIDQEDWKIIDKVTAEGRSVQKMDIRTDQVKTRSEKMAFITNGRNTVQLLDWQEKTSIVRHDPVVRVIGPDAPEIATEFCSNLLVKLVDRLMVVKMADDVAKDIAGLVGIGVEILKSIEADLKAEAESLITQALRFNK